MADLRLHRDHTLGLARARKVALKWAEHIEEKLDMECTLIEGDFSDVLEFTRSGVDGRMVVAADHFKPAPDRKDGSCFQWRALR